MATRSVCAGVALAGGSLCYGPIVGSQCRSGCEQCSNTGDGWRSTTEENIGCGARPFKNGNGASVRVFKLVCAGVGSPVTKALLVSAATGDGAQLKPTLHEGPSRWSDLDH